MPVDVVVVGAGLSGLVTAHRLHRAGYSVRVLEAAARPGGVIGSERRAGVLFERGPNSAMDTSPSINALLNELGIGAERINASKAAARRYVVSGGRLTALPTSAGSFITTPLFSAAAKIRLFGEPFIRRAPGQVEESIAQFVRRRLGHEFLDYVVEPFVSGIYAGDPEQLSLPAAFPRLHELEQRYGSLFIGALRAARQRRKEGATPKIAATSFSFRDGMQALTDALAAGLPAVECGNAACGLARGADESWIVKVAGSDDSVRSSRALVLALPAYSAAPLVRAFAPRAADALAGIAYAPIAIVVSAYRRDDVAHPLNGFGFLAPSVERPRLLGTLFSSTMFEHRSGDGTVVFTSFVGGRRNPALAAASEIELLETVHDELVHLVGAGGQPLMTEVTRWPQAIPQYTFGHRERIGELKRAEQEHPGLFFCANYRGGVSISDCISRGTETAQWVAEHLGPSGRDR
jgi:protoporphyrinogen/coproporphyrinogen III oxidase